MSSTKAETEPEEKKKIGIKKETKSESFIDLTGISNTITNLKNESLCFVIIDCDNTRQSFLISKFYAMLVNLFWEHDVVKHHYITPKFREESSKTTTTSSNKGEDQNDEIVIGYVMNCIQFFSKSKAQTGKKKIVNVVYCVNDILARKENARKFLVDCTSRLQSMILNNRKELKIGALRVMYELFVDPPSPKEKKDLIEKLDMALFSSHINFGERFDEFCNVFKMKTDDVFDYHDAFNLHPPPPITLTLKQRPIIDYIGKKTMRIVTTTSVEEQPSDQNDDQEVKKKKKKIQVSRCPYCNTLEENVQNRNNTKEHENNCSFNISPMTIQKWGDEKEKIVKRTIIILVIGERGKVRADVFRDCFELDSLTYDQGKTDYFVTTIEILDEKVSKSMNEVNKYLADLIPQTSLTAMRKKGKRTHQKPAAIGIESLFVFCDQELIKDGKELVDFPGGVHAVHYNVLLSSIRSTDSEKEKTLGNDFKFSYDQDVWYKNIGAHPIMKESCVLGTMFVMVDLSSFILNLDWCIELTKAHHYLTRFNDVPYYLETDVEVCEIDQFNNKVWSNFREKTEPSLKTELPETLPHNFLESCAKKRKDVDESDCNTTTTKSIKLEPKE